MSANVLAWLGAQWMWCVTTGIAVYGAVLATRNKRRQDRQEARELEPGRV
jgi:hypothetical protein